ncbi:hypothetical protein [Metaclostridioides mangenotii]|uniref:hypothetical protein n=1 Tax=Metaclostridioides mangenotii TaxID=1540 RepID=UPI0028EB4EC1|nr:hypothetical protein [Clostridioides mangenotii]
MLFVVFIHIMIGKDFSKRSKLSVGRTVFNYVEKRNDTELSKIAEFVGKDSSNTAIYRRK